MPVRVRVLHVLTVLACFLAGAAIFNSHALPNLDFTITRDTNNLMTASHPPRPLEPPEYIDPKLDFTISRDTYTLMTVSHPPRLESLIEFLNFIDDRACPRVSKIIITWLTEDAFPELPTLKNAKLQVRRGTPTALTQRFMPMENPADLEDDIIMSIDGISLFLYINGNVWP